MDGKEELVAGIDGAGEGVTVVEVDDENEFDVKELSIEGDAEWPCGQGTRTVNKRWISVTYCITEPIQVGTLMVTATTH